MSTFVRTADYEDAARVAQIQVSCWQNTYAGILDATYLANMSVINGVRWWQNFITLSEGDNDHNLLVIVDELDNVMGFASYGPLRDAPKAKDETIQSDLIAHACGEIGALYIDVDFQSQGLGRELIETTFAALSSLNYQACRIWVLAENNARFFYEAVGGVRSEERTIKVAGGEHREIAYDFPL